MDSQTSNGFPHKLDTVLVGSHSSQQERWSFSAHVQSLMTGNSSTNVRPVHNTCTGDLLGVASYGARDNRADRGDHRKLYMHIGQRASAVYLASFPEISFECDSRSRRQTEVVGRREAPLSRVWHVHLRGSNASNFPLSR